MREAEDRCKSLRNACDEVFRTGLFILLEKNGCPHAPADEGIQLGWLTAVLMDNNNLTSDSFQKCFLLTILCETWTIKRQQMVKMNDRVPEETLSISSLNHVSKSTPAQNFRKKLGLIISSNGFVYPVRFCQTYPLSIDYVSIMRLYESFET